MTEPLKPNQALFLWRMITGKTLDVREPKKSQAKPDLKKDRQALITQGYLETEKRGRAEHLLLTDKAWAWAEATLNVNLLRSPSPVGAEALEGLLHRLLPFLQSRQLPLAALFTANAVPEASASAAEPSTSPRLGAPEAQNAQATARDGRDAWSAIEHACLALGGGQRKVRVHLKDLRAALPQVARAQLDQSLIQLQREGRLVLYREDNTAALTSADIEAALLVGDAPRHLVYLED